MKNQSFMKIEITPVKTIGDTKEKLEEARKIGDATDKDEVLTGIKSMNIDYDNNKIVIETQPALWPFNPKLHNHFGEEFFDFPYLSVLGHVYTGRRLFEPEKVLVHKRSTRVGQGRGEISVSYAGYVTFGETPQETAVREFREELNFSESELPEVLFLENRAGPVITNSPTACLDITVHYMGKERIRNPVLGFVNYVNEKVAEKYPTVDTLEGLETLSTRKDFEVAGMAWIPYTELKQFWEDATKANRVYSISRETTENLMSYFDVLSK